MDDQPSVADVQGDNLFEAVARKHWLGSSKPVTRVHQKVVTDELWEPLQRSNFSPSAINTLETLGALERYLWPGFNFDSSNQHALLIAFILNAKRAENLPTWDLFDRRADFSVLFRRFLTLSLDAGLDSRVRVQLLVTIIGAFQSLDSGIVRKECAPLVSISVWHKLHSEIARNRILEKHSQFKKAWKAANKRYDGADNETQARQRFDRAWLHSLILDFIDICYNPDRQTVDNTVYCERFIELLSDLQSQFPTRRYVNTLIQNLNLLVLVKLSPLYRNEENGLLRDFHILLRHYTFFPIDDHTGQQMSRSEVAEAYTAQLAHLQRTALKNFPEKLKLLALSNYGSLRRREELASHVESLSDEELKTFVTQLGYRVEYANAPKVTLGRKVMLELLVTAYEKIPSYHDMVETTPLLPTEQSLYEASFLRNESYDGHRPLAIPKLNLQYLTAGDFLWRSFILFRCESFYAIRKDMEDTVKRLKPAKDFRTGTTRLEGSSRMACAIPKPAIIDVLPPKVGQDIPSEVRAEITLNTSRMGDAVRSEWESLRPKEVVYLLAVEVSDDSRMLMNGNNEIPPEFSAPFKVLRCAEVVGVQDQNGKPLRLQNNQANGHRGRPRQRRLIVKLDPLAYKQDAADKGKGKPDVYESINVVVRRHNRENNFKPMLESIQNLTMSEVPLPSWLQDVFLGLGDPAGATYKNLPSALQSVDFRDTFLNWNHLQESFPGECVQAEGDQELSPPYVLSTSKVDERSDRPTSSKKRKREDGAGEQQDGVAAVGADSSLKSSKTPSKVSRKRGRDEMEQEDSKDSIWASTYHPPNMGPYPADEPKTNNVRFTPAQVEAIRSGTQPGLTVVVGPPGTGKTDVATQIINNIYHNFPNERTLLVTHSNQALNQLFQKIVSLDIDERHLLRLGHGEGELQLDTDASYSKHGRVESFLEIGSRYLAEVSRLAASINAPGAHGNSCETAGYFDQVYIQPLWKQYWDHVTAADISAQQAMEAFPLHFYFSNAPQPVFPPNLDKAAVLEIAKGCNRHVTKIFSELADIRPFEILRQDRFKSNYLLTKEARIIAMTSTHAAIRRQEIADLGFAYDNVVMEEAAQITEIENFIPLALQYPKSNPTGLKRVVLCGDHLQNSPIIQNLAFRQYANLEQSLFLRLVRLGVPTIQLDRQGRARPSLAELYSWRYNSLGSLPHVSSAPEFTAANAGFKHEVQFLNVPDYKGKGESEPTPHFVQNLGEAEYAVALFQFMRLLGYPAKGITILTMYAGQRALIRDVLNHRCKNSRLFGLPRTVSTVDRYQGEQNDYVILSLVRTAKIGYLRDIRRLTVALSRARLGLYIVGRRTVFEACPELKPAFDRLFTRPDKLELVVGEMYPTQRQIGDEAESTTMEGVEHIGQYVYEMTEAKIKSLSSGKENLPPMEEQGIGLGEDAEDDEGDGGEVDDYDEEETLEEPAALEGIPEEDGDEAEGG